MKRPLGFGSSALLRWVRRGGKREQNRERFQPTTFMLPFHRCSKLLHHLLSIFNFLVYILQFSLFTNSTAIASSITYIDWSVYVYIHVYVNVCAHVPQQYCKFIHMYGRYKMSILTPYSGLKNPCFSHQGYQAASTQVGLYAAGSGQVTSTTKKKISL